MFQSDNKTQPYGNPVTLHQTQITKTTQGRASLLIEQTGNRTMQNKILGRVVNNFAEPESGSKRRGNRIAGALFWVKLDQDGNPSMTYNKKSNEKKANFPEPVLKFCCEEVLRLLCDKSKGVMGFTEHNRQDLFNSGNNYLFRCNLFCRSGSKDQFQSTVLI